jgi:tetratricopeptide (TPR) repeat protein
VGKKQRGRASPVRSIRPETTGEAFVRIPSLVLACLLILMPLVAFIPAVRSGWIWDDDRYVTRNETLRDLDGLAKIWFSPGATPQYYPLVHTSFWIESRLWGLNPMAYHLVNVLLHACAALLLWRILSRLQVAGAWVAAAIFALHPVQVESVAWVTERKNVLSGVFYLAAALAYFSFSPVSGRAAATPPDRRRWKFYAAAVIFFVFALLSKTVTATLPAAILIVLWWKRERLGWRDVAPLAPLFAVGAGMGLVTAWLERYHVGAEGAEWSFSWIQRVLIAGRAVFFYAKKLFLPFDLTFIYPRWDVDPRAFLPYVYPVLAAGVVVSLWLLRRRIGKGALTGALFFVGTLFPVLGFLNVFPFRYSLVADHFQYLACIGLIVFVVELLAARLRVPPFRSPLFGTCLAVGVLLFLGVLTFRQCRIYKDEKTLWLDTIRKNPEGWMAHNNLGLLLMSEGRTREALDHFDRAVRAAPGVFEPYDNRGSAYMVLGNYGPAIEDFDQSIRLNPAGAKAYCNRGAVYGEMGRMQEAISDYDRAVEVNPDYAPGYYNRGKAYLILKNYNAAIADNNLAIRLKPAWAEAYSNRGNAYYNLGKLEPAIRDFSKAVELKPDLAPAWYNRALAYYRMRRYEKAWSDVQIYQQSGGTPEPAFLNALRKAIGGGE